MIPLRYREVLPPYWYEIDMAERHFSVMEEAMNGREKITNELRDQFILQRATYALDMWEWIYFRKVQSGSFAERREAIRKKRWAKRPFKLPVLRLIGSQCGKLLNVREDFLAKEIYFEYDIADETVDLMRLHRDFEYIRPVHVKPSVPNLHGKERIEIVDTVTCNLRRYHQVHEFRVGMTPMKYQNEEVL
ncbi:DUF2313 domain-containing protein [Aneurinibacillus aneurinilyticus]|uniref:DUF2313 domain-containing protein n=1 Tax=Aneurinibacillus aneurinilyticus ATCC 12856 TaxID=649747 RepID=U1YDP9_ANEAE|nr:DUF2313 domain-containing protein [Aneurinibacillus aneurinilyticus]ERI10217.1 hypothetical protein HMPREF0083_01661 [Aneurinibacillus aneurinilyticus ATCC 12856]MED0705932.1 DUF2313 domain-containing protein [Aneurinibacillus aneurinilyticus]MED0722679.1 DUF2313 domain-containing protein [Aneurinibacillus aneurinilyticus]MED0731401.1 DUF2313 domain-containing protein [Aneurinibacillus aneurinilyticus]MED0740157.1 DUF2313 domain-containing protein [Aneurinibacillus aneurinilyticus]